MSRREQLLQAVLAVLRKVDGVDLVERNRTSEVDKSHDTVLLLFDGDLETPFDRENPRRTPIFRQEATPEIMGWVRGSDAEVGTTRDDLFSRTMQAIWTDDALLDLLDEFDGDISVDGTDFYLPQKATSKTRGVFIVGLRLGFTFDPANP